MSVTKKTTNRKLKDIFYITGNIDIDMLSEIKQQILTNINRKDEIVLLIDSCGGEIEPTISFISFLRIVGKPITTVNIGLCQSAALLLLSMGDKGKRYALAETTGLHHAARYYAPQDENGILFKHLEASTAYYDRVNKKLIKLFSEFTSGKLINPERGEEIYLEPLDMLNNSIIDRIISSGDVLRKIIT